MDDNKTILNEYLDKYVKGYLIGDLERMMDLEYHSAAVGTNGELGYACLLVISVGMELLGSLLSGKRGKSALDSFWTVFQGQVSDKYTDSIRDMFWVAIRCKLAHMYILTNQIRTERKGLSSKHLQQINGQTYIDGETLFKDFCNVYEIIKAKLLNDSSNLEARVKSIRFEVNQRSEIVTSALVNSIVGAHEIDPNMIGASGIKGTFSTR